jgi:hypothetical protein
MTLHLTPESALALATALHDPAYALQAKRKAAADAIEDLINFLDETEGDCDLEPTLGAPEVPPQTMVPGRPSGWRVVQGTQERWADGGNAAEADDCEDQNEDGGCLPQGVGMIWRWFMLQRAIRLVRKAAGLREAAWTAAQDANEAVEAYVRHSTDGGRPPLVSE